MAAAACSGAVDTASTSQASDDFWGGSVSSSESASPGDSAWAGVGSEGSDGTVSSQTVAQVEIERSRTANGTSAEAMAHFVATPASAAITTRAALELAGLDQPLPAIGSCHNPFDYGNRPIASAGELRLLEAGDVIITSDAALVELAPRAFPSISSLASGVVYTTRDRGEHSLPSRSQYTVTVDGSDHVDRLALEGRAPDELSAATLGGLPLQQVTEVSAQQPLDITWAVSEPTDSANDTDYDNDSDYADVVYVDIVAVDRVSADHQAAELGQSQPRGFETTAIRCSFNDSDGAGTIPQATLASLGYEPVQLSLHRRRTFSSVSSTGHRARLRFDFAVSHFAELVR